MQLVIGDKNTSSWSMRPWLPLKRVGVPFEEIWVRMRQPDTTANLLVHSGTGKAPVLKDGDLTVWDTLAICEYLADKFPAAKLWPGIRSSARWPAQPAPRCIPGSPPCAANARWTWSPRRASSFPN